MASKHDGAQLTRELSRGKHDAPPDDTTTSRAAAAAPALSHAPSFGRPPSFSAAPFGFLPFGGAAPGALAAPFLPPLPLLPWQTDTHGAAAAAAAAAMGTTTKTSALWDALDALAMRLVCAHLPVVDVLHFAVTCVALRRQLVGDQRYWRNRVGVDFEGQTHSLRLFERPPKREGKERLPESDPRSGRLALALVSASATAAAGAGGSSAPHRPVVSVWAPAPTATAAAAVATTTTTTDPLWFAEFGAAHRALPRLAPFPDDLARLVRAYTQAGGADRFVLCRCTGAVFAGAHVTAALNRSIPAAVAAAAGDNSSTLAADGPTYRPRFAFPQSVSVGTHRVAALLAWLYSDHHADDDDATADATPDEAVRARYRRAHADDTVVAVGYAHTTVCGFVRLSRFCHLLARGQERDALPAHAHISPATATDRFRSPAPPTRARPRAAFGVARAYAVPKDLNLNPDAVAAVDVPVWARTALRRLAADRARTAPPPSVAANAAEPATSSTAAAPAPQTAAPAVAADAGANEQPQPQAQAQARAQTAADIAADNALAHAIAIADAEGDDADGGPDDDGGDGDEDGGGQDEDENDDDDAGIAAAVAARLAAANRNRRNSNDRAVAAAVLLDPRQFEVPGGGGAALVPAALAVGDGTVAFAATAAAAAAAAAATQGAATGSAATNDADADGERALVSDDCWDRRRGFVPELCLHPNAGTNAASDPDAQRFNLLTANHSGGYGALFRHYGTPALVAASEAGAGGAGGLQTLMANRLIGIKSDVEIWALHLGGSLTTERSQAYTVYDRSRGTITVVRRANGV